MLRRILQEPIFLIGRIDCKLPPGVWGVGQLAIAMAFAERAQRWARCSHGGLSAAEDMVGGEVQAS